MGQMTRRTVLGASAFGLIAVEVAGVTEWLSPAEAKARAVPLTVLNTSQARTLEALGEVLLPGARQAGLVHYIDSQLAKPAPQSLLMIRYLDVPPPHMPFYAGAIAALDGYARATTGSAFADLGVQAQTAIVTTISKSQPEGWQGPPAPLIYFVMRADAVDVVYGTEAGFERLNVPYVPHIAPTKPW